MKPTEQLKAIGIKKVLKLISKFPRKHALAVFVWLIVREKEGLWPPSLLNGSAAAIPLSTQSQQVSHESSRHYASRQLLTLSWLASYYSNMSCQKSCAYTIVDYLKKMQNRRARKEANSGSSGCLASRSIRRVGEVQYRTGFQGYMC